MPVAYEIIGWFGTAFAIAMFMPQVIKVIRTKDVSTLSRFSFAVYAFGCSMWVIFCGITNVWQGFACNGLILILMCVIFWYMLKKKIFYFFALIIYVVAVFVLAVVLSFVVKDVHISVRYVFVILAGGALAISFVPQVRTIFINRDFKSYSFLTSTMLNVCNVFWGIFWAAKIFFDPTTGLEGTMPVYVIAFITTIAQIIVQVAAAPFYFISIRKKNESRAKNPAVN